MTEESSGNEELKVEEGNHSWDSGPASWSGHLGPWGWGAETQTPCWGSAWWGGEEWVLGSSVHLLTHWVSPVCLFPCP